MPLGQRGWHGGRTPAGNPLSRLRYVRIARFARGDDVGYGIVEDVQPDGSAGVGPGPDTGPSPYA